MACSSSLSAAMRRPRHARVPALAQPFLLPEDTLQLQVATNPTSDSKPFPAPTERLPLTQQDHSSQHLPDPLTHAREQEALSRKAGGSAAQQPPASFVFIGSSHVHQRVIQPMGGKRRLFIAAAVNVFLVSLLSSVGWYIDHFDLLTTTPLDPFQKQVSLSISCLPWSWL